MGKILVVDRIEGDIAVCENRRSKRILQINVARLPAEIREGTVLKYKRGTFSIAMQTQKIIAERIQEKMNDLWEN